ncbi:MAG: Ig-like domain-containing protein [Verrucomicrobiales bacterium]
MSKNRRHCALFLLTFLLWSGLPALGQSPFYKFEIIAKAGDTVDSRPGRQARIVRIERNVSVNTHGEVAFVAETEEGDIIMVGDAARAPRRISFGATDRSYSFPQINSNGLVAARDLFEGTSAIRTWNANTAPPGNFDIHALSTESPYVSLFVPTISDDNRVAFTARVDDEPTPVIYQATPGGAVERVRAIPNSQVFPYGGAAFGGDVDANNTIRMVALLNGTEESGSLGVAFKFKREENEGFKAFSVASTELGWSRLGRSPSLSNEGFWIAYAGQKSFESEGIYEAFFADRGGQQSRSLIDLHTVIGTDLDGTLIRFKSIDFESRVAWAKRQGTLGPRPSAISFIATPTRASQPNIHATGQPPLLFTEHTGIWVALISTDLAQQDFPVEPFVLPVIQEGDHGLLNGTMAINELAVYDQLASIDGVPPQSHYVAFWASTSQGDVVVRAEYRDTDEDGLPDHWEKDGIDIDRDGTIDFDFGPDADPMRRDLFLEIDWTNDRAQGYPGGWSNAPAPGVLEELERMFKSAPVTNPDGSGGIVLHVDAGAGVDANGTSLSRNFSGLFQGGETIGMPGDASAHPDVIQFGLPGESDAVSGVNVRPLFDVKREHFGGAQKGARELVYHYAVLADFHDFHRSSTGIISGTGLWTVDSLTTAAASQQALSGHAIMVTSGTGQGQVRRIREQTGARLSVFPNWDVVPTASSEFVILDGSMGAGEGRRTEQLGSRSAMGNDLLVTLGAWDGQPAGSRGNAYVQWRTFAHELGHNFGLRHGGIDDDRFKGSAYQSLMSYSHLFQLSGTAVTSFSDRFDQTFDDWSNLRMRFYTSPNSLGISVLGLNAGTASAEPSFTQSDYEQLNGSALDLTPPQLLVLSPSDGSVVANGESLTISAVASDGTDLVSVEAGFDLNGDGALERFPATPQAGGQYSIQLPATSGASGTRELVITAKDPSLNQTVQRVPVDAVLFHAAGTFPAGGARQMVPFGPVNIPGKGTVTIEVISTPTVSGGGQDAVVTQVSVAGVNRTLTPACTPGKCISVFEATAPGNLTGTLLGPETTVGGHPMQAYTLNVTFAGDLIPPSGTIESPSPGALFYAGEEMVVEVLARDNAAVGAVTISADLDGSGNADGPGESFPATLNVTGNYQAVVYGLRGPAGDRTLTATIADASGNTVQIAGTFEVAVDTTPPTVEIVFPGEGGSVGLGGTLEVQISAGDNLGMKSVTAAFDSDGNGSAETIEATALDSGLYRAVFGSVAGSAGSRTVTIIGTDIGGTTASAQLNVSVSDGGVGRQSLLTADGTIPAQSGRFGGGFRQTVPMGPITIPSRGLVTFTVTSTPPVRREVQNIARADTTVERVSFNGEAQPRLQVTCNAFGADPAICTSTFEAPGAGELTFDLLGPGTWNTFGEFAGHAAQDYAVEVIFEPIDAAPPVIEFTSPGAGANQNTGQSLNVDLSVRDPAGIGSVTVRFDINGDGDTGDAGESLTASSTGGANYRVTFGSVTGGAGTRIIDATATDAFGNGVTAEHYVSVGGAIGGGRQTLLIQSGDFSAESSAFSGGSRKTQPFPSVLIPGPGRIAIEVTATPPVRREVQNIPRYDAAVERIRFNGRTIVLTPDCNAFGADPAICTTYWDSPEGGLLGGDILGPGTYNISDEFAGHAAQSYTLKITFEAGPGVSSVVPGQGSMGGRTPVTVRGGGFEENAVVLFGNVAAANVEVISSTEIRCITPPGLAGATHVTVINPDPDNLPFNFGGPYGLFGIRGDAFTYTEPQPPADPLAERLVATFTGSFPEKRITELQETAQIGFEIPGSGDLRFEAWAFVPILNPIAGPDGDRDNLEYHNDSTAVPWFVGNNGSTFYMEPSCTPLDFAYGPVICESLRTGIPRSAAGSARMQVTGPAKWSARWKALEVCELLAAPEQHWSIAVWHTPDELPVAADSYEDWKAGNFTPLQQNFPGISGPSADPDKDTYPNAAEFVLNGNPNAEDGSALFRASTAQVGLGTFPVVEMTVRSGLTGVTAKLEASTDLEAWSELYDIAADPEFTSPLIVSKEQGEGTVRLIVRDVLPISLLTSSKYYRLNVATTADGNGGGSITGTTELVFDIDGISNFSNMDQNYGDRVVAATMGGFHYGGSGSFTPNIEVSYGPDGADPAFWASGYGDLQNILFEDLDRFGQLEITMTADDGFLVQLRSWDMAAYSSNFASDPAIDRVSIRDGNGTILWDEADVTISKSTRTAFDFSETPFEARTLILRFESANLLNSSDDIAIDNIVFGQRPQ